MAHQISFNNGKAEMAYSGETPWHGLGVKVDGLKTAAEMIEAAGLSWQVRTVPVYVAGTGANPYLPVPGFVGIERVDKGRVFGVVSDRYTPIQNTQAASVMDALITEGGAHVEVCGALGEGERCWMLAELPDSFEVVKGDKVRPYVLLAWGHDGKHGLAAKLTPIRVVCNNTLTLALGDKWSRTADVYVKHTKNAKLQIEAAQTALGLVKRQAEQTAEAYRLLAATPLEKPRDYFETVFPRPSDELPDGYKERLERWERHQAEVLGCYTVGRGVEVPGVAGTAWAGYNAVTEWVDHVYPVLQSGKVSPVRQASVLFGGYSDVKARALNAALELAGSN